MDKLRAMRTFVAIAEAGSLTAAARELESSLPAVVRLLAGLEAELGARLLQRTTRRIALTEAGRRYLERCRAVDTLIDEAEAEVRAEQTEPRGSLTLTAPVLFGARHITSGVSAFVQRYPEVRVEFLLLDRLVNLVEEGIDVGVRIGELEDSSLIARPASSMRRLTVAAPSYLARRARPAHPRDLLEHNCIVFSGRGPWLFLADQRELPVAVQGNLRVNHAAVGARACAAGVGIGSFFAYQVAGELTSGALQVLLESYELPPRPIHVVYPQARLLPARTRFFIDFLLQHIQSEQGAWQTPGARSASPQRRAAAPRRRSRRG